MALLFLRTQFPNITPIRPKVVITTKRKPFLARPCLEASYNPLIRLHITFWVSIFPSDILNYLIESMINCMSNGVLERTDSYKVGGSPKQHIRLCFLKVERSWSGNLTPPRYEEVRNDHDEAVVAAGKEKKMCKGRRRRYNSEAGALFGEPKLVRSSGMRRDWSFEDLRSKMIENCRAVK